MGEVVCSVKFGDSIRRDLVLPDHVPVHLLVKGLARALGLPTSNEIFYELHVIDNKEAMRIPDSRTLQQAFILNGARIELIKCKENINMRAYLEGPGGMQIRLRENTILGRLTPDVHVDVDLTTWDTNTVTSRRHAAINHDSFHFVIKDLNSRNGSYVNKVKIKKAESIVLHSGDQLCLGGIEKGVTLTFYQET